MRPSPALTGTEPSLTDTREVNLRSACASRYGWDNTGHVTKIIRDKPVQLTCRNPVKTQRHEPQLQRRHQHPHGWCTVRLVPQRNTHPMPLTRTNLRPNEVLIMDRSQNKRTIRERGEIIAHFDPPSTSNCCQPVADSPWHVPGMLLIWQISQAPFPPRKKPQNRPRRQVCTACLPHCAGAAHLLLEPILCIQDERARF